MKKEYQSPEFSFHKVLLVDVILYSFGEGGNQGGNGGNQGGGGFAGEGDGDW